MPELKCPVCFGDVKIPDDALDGELFEHEECGAQLELVTSNGSKTLRLAEEVGEDWGE
ncbi:hypothetical protein HRbin02_01517 [Candidatus Calditenuaceae archaeon HR02]|nr:hypothetical protein HRbin02_01517 [Candidatus Calditenuaceae archaeon HR02]